MTSTLALRVVARPEIVERRDLLLPRGVWQIDVPLAECRIFLLVTSSGEMLLQRVAATEEEEPDDALLVALNEVLHAYDPRPRLVGDESPHSPVMGAATLRVLRDLGYLNQSSDASVPSNAELAP